MASDEEIQGSKDAATQDLERKLRFKEDLLNNVAAVCCRGWGQDEQGQVVGAVPGASEFGPSAASGLEPHPHTWPSAEHCLHSWCSARSLPCALQVDVCLWRESMGGGLRSPSMNHSWGLRGIQ